VLGACSDSCGKAGAERRHCQRQQPLPGVPEADGENADQKGVVFVERVWPLVLRVLIAVSRLLQLESQERRDCVHADAEVEKRFGQSFVSWCMHAMLASIIEVTVPSCVPTSDLSTSVVVSVRCEEYTWY